MLAAAREEWFALSPADWREAFNQHPRIGDREALRQRFPTAGDLSAQEQAGVDGAADDLIAELAEFNERYVRQFGYIFIVCATGRSAVELLSELKTRVANAPDREIRVAAEEQAKITELRLLALQ